KQNKKDNNEDKVKKLDRRIEETLQQIVEQHEKTGDARLFLGQVQVVPQVILQPSQHLVTPQYRARLADAHENPCLGEVLGNVGEQNCLLHFIRKSSSCQVE